MTKDLVIGIDSSTQSTKSIAWTKDGEAVAEGRAPTPMSNPEVGRFEQDPEDWWKAAVNTLRALVDQVDPARVAGIAISNQRETVAFADTNGHPTRPAIVWLDERGRDEIDRMGREIDLEEVHRITGKPPDLTPVVYRLSWLHHHARADLDQAAKITDAHAFLASRLTGRMTSSWTSADPFGVMDIAKKQWWPRLLTHLRLRPDQFAELARPGDKIGTLTVTAADATGLVEGTPVFAAGGDGQCAGLGVNAARPGVVYLNLGTALITGAWAAEPMTGMAWRTMTSPTGEGYFLEGCQRAGAFLLNWIIDTFAGGRDDPMVFERLEEEAAGMPIGSDGVAVCPYLTGCMDPHWDPSARGTIDGLGPQHGIGHIYRATLEALTLESARCIEAMRRNGLAPEKIVAVGGGGNSSLWTKMFADATGLPLHVSNSLEASALGAGMSAAVGADWFDGFDAAAEAMSGMGPPILPDASVRAAWQAASARQAAAYRPAAQKL
ncbi:MAG: FGGY-family carbohydrate kinase [Pseudomonadota bacterium]